MSGNWHAPMHCVTLCACLYCVVGEHSSGDCVLLSLCARLVSATECRASQPLCVCPRWTTRSDLPHIPSGAKSKLPPACIWQRPKGFDLAPGGLVFGTCQIQVIGLTFGTKATLTSHGEADSSQTTLHLALSGAPAPSSSAQRRGHASDEAFDAQDDLEEEGDDDDSADSESDHEPEK